MNKLYFLVIILFFLSFSAVSQGPTKNLLPSYIPPSPEASSLGKYVEHPVGYFTGTPSVEIPLFEISSGRIEVPVTLSYHGSGVKVEEIASRVGMGWTLNAGGVVTRTIKSLPDEYGETLPCGEGTYGAYGYFSDKVHEYLSLSANYEKISSPGDIYDLEPDLYFYNFGNKKGKFFFERKHNNNSPYILNLDPVKVKGPWDGTNTFSIKTEDGLIYRFNAIEATNSSDRSWCGLIFNYNSSWFLTEIEDPTTGKKVQFEYTTASPYPRIYYGRYSGSSLSGYDCTLTGGGGDTYLTINHPQILSKITYDEGYIEFVPGESRQDLENDKAYTEIKQFTKGGVLLKSFNFTYAYASSGTTVESKRLFLESVQEKGFNGISLPPYKFYYNNRNLLPARNSPEQDIWGFFNDNNETTWRAPKVYNKGLFFDLDYLPYKRSYEQPQVIDGADRSCNILTVDYGVLNKVVYPTKGYTEYTYEPHEFSGYTGGGIRIKEITDYESNGSRLLSKSYSYNTGFLGGGHPQVAAPTANGLMRFSQSLSGLGTNNGSNVGYTSVVEYLTDGVDENGYTIYFYLTEKDIRGSVKHLDTYCGHPRDLIDNTYYPFFEWESRESRRGLLDMVHYYDNLQERDPVKIVDYTYDLKEGYNFTVHSEFVVDRSVWARGSRSVREEKYVLVSQKETIFDVGGNSLSTEKNYTYTDNLFVKTKSVQESDGTTLTTSYKYPFDFNDLASGGVMKKMKDLNYINPVITELEQRDGVTISGKVNNYYDFPIYLGVSQIQLSQVFLYKTGTTSASNVTDPSTPGPAYEKRVEYKKYDSKGNLELFELDGQYESLEWSVPPKTLLRARKVVQHPSSLVFLLPPQSWAEVKGNDAFTGDGYYVWDGYNEPFPFTLDNPGTYYLTFWAKGGTVRVWYGSRYIDTEITETAPDEWKFYNIAINANDQEWTGAEVILSGTAKVDEVRFSEEKALITTYYYDAYDRLKEVCDPKSEVVRFEYDAFNRLINVKDRNGDILKNYQYNYQVIQ